MKERRKVIPFEITEDMVSDEQMDKMIREQLVKAADQIERELESKAELEWIEAPDDMYDEIVRKLKESGKYDAD